MSKQKSCIGLKKDGHMDMTKIIIFILLITYTIKVVKYRNNKNKEKLNHWSLYNKSNKNRREI